jgi:hypothetical protein
MTQSNELAIIAPDLGVPPEVIIEHGQAWAKALRTVITKTEMVVNIQGKEYPLAEAWQMVVAFAGMSEATEYVRPLREDADGDIVAYEAKVNLIDANGIVQGSGIATAGMDSFVTGGKKGYDKDRAAQSAAQTWAGSKAARMKFAFVMKMAGIEPTPANEMEAQTDGPPNQQQGTEGPKTNAAPKTITEPQRNRLFAIINAGGVAMDLVRDYVHDAFNLDSTKDLTIPQYEELVAWVQARGEENMSAANDVHSTEAGTRQV